MNSWPNTWTMMGEMIPNSPVITGARTDTTAPQEEDWHRLTAAIGPILKAAFPEAHSVTRLQAAQAIATEVQRLDGKA